MQGEVPFRNYYPRKICVSRISMEVETRRKEFSLGIASLADSTAIGLAGFVSIYIHNLICALPINNSSFLAQFYDQIMMKELNTGLQHLLIPSNLVVENVDISNLDYLIQQNKRQFEILKLSVIRFQRYKDMKL